MPIRKRPPTFQYLPVTRATLLKKQWVETQKIRSKWKALKRKDKPLGEQTIHGDSERREPGPREAKGDESEPEASSSHSGMNSAPAVDDESPPTQKATMHPSRLRQLGSHAPQSHTKAAQPDLSSSQTPKAERTTTNLRDLTQAAYSRSSLHTFKSDPLRRKARSHTSSQGPKERAGRGRGQPNMKLRMNVLLEKIRRDLA